MADITVFEVVTVDCYLVVCRFCIEFLLGYNSAVLMLMFIFVAVFVEVAKRVLHNLI
jgi:hypothetical protein